MTQRLTKDMVSLGKSYGNRQGYVDDSRQVYLLPKSSGRWKSWHHKMHGLGYSFEEMWT